MTRTLHSPYRSPARPVEKAVEPRSGLGWYEGERLRLLVRYRGRALSMVDGECPRQCSCFSPRLSDELSNYRYVRRRTMADVRGPVFAGQPRCGRRPGRYDGSFTPKRPLVRSQYRPPRQRARPIDGRVLFSLLSDYLSNYAVRSGGSIWKIRSIAIAPSSSTGRS